MRAWIVIVAIALAPATAQAQKARTVVVAPLSALGAHDTSASAAQVQAELEHAIARIDGVTVIGSKDAIDQVKKAKRPELRVCDGELACLTALGKLVGADLVVAGEAGGLGEVHVVYLQLIDAAKGKELRSTTLEVGDAASGGALGAAHRLLAPERYLGTLVVAVDTPGALLYVDGKKLGTAPAPAIETSVGTHALRVTHPEYRDFVRFVDVGFAAETVVDVALQQFPIVSTEMTGTGDGKPRSADALRPLPWYRKWWAIAAFSGIVLISAAATAGVIADGVDADTVRPIDP
jgi:hypothetical protein